MAHSQISALLVNGDPYTVRACIQLGISPVVLHGPKLREWGYIQLPPEVEAVFAEDVSSLECVLSSLGRAGMAERRFSFVQTSDERTLVTAAALGKILGVPAMSSDVAVRFRDKWLQKQVVAQSGVAVARSRVVEDVHDLDSSVFDGFEKAVLKPIAGGGTQNTSVVRSREDLLVAAAGLRRRGARQRTFVLEEFVEGEEWVVNGVVFDGVVQFFGVGTYSEPCLTTVASSSALQVETFDPHADADVYDLVRPVAETALGALGLRSGVFHMELFQREEGGAPVFGECAARPGGGVTQEVVHCKFGVDLSAAAVQCAAGVDPKINASVRPETVGSTFLANKPGVLVGYPAPDEIMALPGVEHLRLELPYGSRIKESLAGTFERVGQAVLIGSTPEEFRQRRDFLTTWFDERIVVVPTDASPSQLRTWQGEHWPETVSQFSTYADRP